MRQHDNDRVIDDKDAPVTGAHFFCAQHWESVIPASRPIGPQPETDRASLLATDCSRYHPPRDGIHTT
jgi:hypothetical protein